MKPRGVHAIKHHAQGPDRHNHNYPLESRLCQDRLSEKNLRVIGRWPPGLRNQGGDKDNRAIPGNLLKVAATPGENLAVKLESVIARHGRSEEHTSELQSL